MKKLLLLFAVLLGAVSASQAGVQFNVGVGFPLPPPVYVQPAAPVYVTPPVCTPGPVVVAPGCGYGQYRYGYGYGNYGYHPYGYGNYGYRPYGYGRYGGYGNYYGPYRHGFYGGRYYCR